LTKFIKRVIPGNIWKQLRHSRLSAVDNYHRSFAQRLASVSSEDFTGLTYLMEVQPYDIEVVLQGYMMGIFPTTFYREGYVRWHDPDPRAVLPVQDFHVPKNMKALIRKGTYEVRVDQDFRQIMEKCAEGRGITHITPAYMEVYEQLHQMGYAHSIGAWENGELVGGRFGIALGGFFTGESSFQRARDAGKVVLIRSAEILAAGGFVLHDTGWPTSHMEQFGGKGISRDEFHKLHNKALITPARFDPNAPAIFTMP